MSHRLDRFIDAAPVASPETSGAEVGESPCPDIEGRRAGSQGAGRTKQGWVIKSLPAWIMVRLDCGKELWIERSTWNRHWKVL